MKLLKKSILLCLVAPLLFSLLSFTNVVGDDGILVTIKVFEVSKTNYGDKPKIIIVEGGKSREIELGKGFFPPVLNKNAEILSELLSQYYKEGYKLGPSNVVTYDISTITTYILTK